MLQFPHRKTVFREPPSPLALTDDSVFLFPSVVPEPNQRTHARPPAKPGRNTLPSAPVAHHTQILIHGSSEGRKKKQQKKKAFIPPPSSAAPVCRLASLLQKRPVSQFLTSLLWFLFYFFALASDSSG